MSKKRLRAHRNNLTHLLAKQRESLKKRQQAEEAKAKEEARAEAMRLAQLEWEAFKKELCSISRSEKEVIKMHERFKTAMRKKIKDKDIVKAIYAMINSGLINFKLMLAIPERKVDPSQN